MNTIYRRMSINCLFVDSEFHNFGTFGRFAIFTHKFHVEYRLVDLSYALHVWKMTVNWDDILMNYFTFKINYFNGSLLVFSLTSNHDDLVVFIKESLNSFRSVGILRFKRFLHLDVITTDTSFSLEMKVTDCWILLFVGNVINVVLNVLC